MSTESLQTALERAHRAIDRGVEACMAAAEGDDSATAPLVEAMDALRRHIYLEERFLFPPLREAGMIMPVSVMLREHGELWHTMDSLTALIEEKVDSKRLRDGCSEFLSQLDQHNSKEEPIIYPQTKILSEHAATQFARFIEIANFPDGWTCERA